MVRDGVVAVAHQRTHHRRSHTEHADTVALDHRPEPVRTGVIGHTLVHDQRRPQGQGAADRPRAHHPADVGEPEQAIVLAHVEAVGHVLGRLHRKATVHVHRALGLARGAAGVDDHEGVVGVGVANPGRFRRL